MILHEQKKRPEPLRNVDFHNIQWQHIRGVKMANIAGVMNAPDAFIGWALQHGAVQQPPQ